MSETKINSIILNINEERLTTWFNYSMAVIAFFAFAILEYVRMGLDTDMFTDTTYYTTILTHWLMVVMVMIPMSHEGERSGKKSEKYTSVKNILTDLLSTIRRQGHTSDFEKYLVDYNRGDYYSEIDEHLAHYNLTLRDEAGKINPKATLSELLKQRKFTEEQTVLAEKIIAKHNYDPTTLADFYAMTPQKSGRKELRFNIIKARLFLIIPKLISSFAWLSFTRAMVLELSHTPDFVSAVHIVLKLFTVVWLVVYTFLGTRKVVTERIPIVFNNRINRIKEFAIEYNYRKIYGIEEVD